MLCKEKRKTPLVCLFDLCMLACMDMFGYVCACMRVSVFVIIYYGFVCECVRERLSPGPFRVMTQGAQVALPVG